MKRILLFFAISGIIVACNDILGSKSAGKNKEEKKVSARDYSITKKNSYSDLFFDSTSLIKFISEKKLDTPLSRRLISFYNTRNYQFAWFTSNGLTEQARGFWNLHDYVTTYDQDSTLEDKDLQKRMDNWITEDDLNVVATNKNYLNTELTLTQHFIQYILNNYEKGFVKRKEMERFIPFKKQDPLQLADSLINKKHNDDKYFEDVNPEYSKLKDQLEKYYAIVKNGGWPEVKISKNKKQLTGDEVVILKKRLQISGDLVGNDSSGIFNDTLKTAIKNFQTRYGFTPTGELTDKEISALNVSAMDRLEQLIINMDRMRWQAAEQKGNLIVVNIPEFKLHMYEDSAEVFDMVVVVGKEGHNTMMFNGDLNQVVFSPYWNVPPAIVRNEILPSMEKKPGYLESQHMEIVKNDGELPVIRQKPGTGNALGKVKFLFPNSFNIYFHDTPSKSLFEKDVRAFSHGCIRLKEPEKMARYVLRNQPEWTEDKINDAMNSGEEKYVKVKDPIPVVITYYTAWVDNNGQLNFREDIYDHDKKLANKMFYQD